MLEDNVPPENCVKFNFLRRLTSYAITGECKEKVMPILTGTFNTGKTTLCSLLLSCLSKSAHKSIVTKRNSSSSANPELHMLKGCRISLVSETNEDEIIDDDTVKRMTGAGDEVQSRNLFKKNRQLDT